MSWFGERQIAVTTVVCGTWHTGAVDDKGNLYTWGRGDQGQLGLGVVRCFAAVRWCGLPSVHIRGIHEL